MIAYQAPGSILRNNHIHHNYGSGLFITIQSDGSRADNNRVEYNGIHAVTDGMKGVSGLSVRRSKNVKVFNNIITGNHVSPDSRWKGMDTGSKGRTGTPRTIIRRHDRH